MKDIKNLKDTGFGISSLEYFGWVDNYLLHIKDVITNLVNNINITNYDFLPLLKY